MTEPGAVTGPAGPATADLVAAWLKGTAPADVAPTAGAVNVLIRRWLVPPADGEPWPEDVVLGAIMLAGRMYRRKDSPAGVMAMGADGVAYVSRSDPDVAMLLRIGPYADPVVG